MAASSATVVFYPPPVTVPSSHHGRTVSSPPPFAALPPVRRSPSVALTCVVWLATLLSKVNLAWFAAQHPAAQY